MHLVLHGEGVKACEAVVVELAVESREESVVGPSLDLMLRAGRPDGNGTLEVGAISSRMPE